MAPTLARAGLTWLVLVVVAVGLGSARVALVEPLVGAWTAHALGTLAVLVGHFAVTWASVRWIRPDLATRPLLGVGAAWLALTVVFEFGFGRALIGASWQQLLAAYDPRTGSLWLLVLANVLLAPILAARLRRS